MSNRQQLDTILNVTLSDALWTSDYERADALIGEAIRIVLYHPDVDPTRGAIRELLCELSGLMMGALIGDAPNWEADAIDTLRLAAQRLVEGAADSLQEG